MRRILGATILALLGFLAATNVASACLYFWYQPAVPKVLAGNE